MPGEAFNHWWYNIHFVNNEALPKCGEAGWDPLQKIQPVLTLLMKCLQAAWTLGLKICIDESMCLYTGRAILWKQYMPVKPISHGMKI